MDEETRELLESIALELERLRVLREFELGATVVEEEGNLYVRPTGGE